MTLAHPDHAGNPVFCGHAGLYWLERQGDYQIRKPECLALPRDKEFFIATEKLGHTAR
jgi:hypothetical protein